MTSTRAVRRRRTGRALALTVALAGAWVTAGCRGAEPPDTPRVPLAEGTSGGQAWRLEGWRAAGQPCTSLLLTGVDRPPIDRCGTRRTALRHLEPASVTVGTRRLVFSPLPSESRRVRIDTVDGSIRVEPARTAAGYPARFLLVELDAANIPVTVRVFADGGRAVVT